MPKNKLFDNDSEDEKVVFDSNNEYAKKYDSWREKEELHKLEQKYGDKALDSDVSDSDSEDESDEPPDISEEMESQFLKTLSMLKTKDPRIYDPNYKFFQEEDKKPKEGAKQKESKQTTLVDSEESSDEDGEIFRIEKKAEDILKENEGMTRKNTLGKKTKLKDYLVGKADHLDDPVEQDLAPLKALWSDPQLNEGELFLRDYILDKRYLDNEDKATSSKALDAEDLEADEKTVEEQGKFERAYNFRFEEPDEEYLKRFPRTMSYIRPKDDRRSRKRAEVSARKEEEKRKKMEEIARLKALKLKEIQEKIAKIKEVTGNQQLAFDEGDIEGDFDAEEHDRRMRKIFDEEYYGGVDEEKPTFPDLDEELEIENWDKYDAVETQQATACNDEGAHCEDEDFNMDADYDPKQARLNLLEELKQNMGKKRRNRKRSSKLAQILAKEKPKFVPQAYEKTYSAYMEEYYKMDCEDVIGGDLPTRFKYRQVVPNDYGLSVEEILLADDKELTQWVPLKKIVKHRPENVEKGELKTYAIKAADVQLKRKILPSLFKDLPEVPDIVVPATDIKKNNKQNNNKVKEEENIINFQVKDLSREISSESNVRKKKRKKKDQQKDTDFTETGNSANETKVDDSNIESVNAQTNVMPEDNSIKITKTKKGNKKKKIANNFIVEDISQANESIEHNTKQQEINKRKYLKRKNQETNVDIPSKKKKNKHTNDLNSKKHKNKTKDRQKLKTSNNTDSENPLAKLSDERLKAYGLNPKKYRSFLKYKKF